MWLRDIRQEVEKDGAFLTKYMANHYLSWNVSKRLNVGLFESVIWDNSNDRGFDVNYLNPIVFFRAIEFESGQDAGNAILGASAKYKWNNKVNICPEVNSISHNTIRNGNLCKKVLMKGSRYQVPAYDLRDSYPFSRLLVVFLLLLVNCPSDSSGEFIN